MPERAALVRFLRLAVAFVLVLGATLVAWLVSQALLHPEIQARQLGSVAPLWIPMALFVAGFTALAAMVFRRAAQRVAAGEDLFAQRHRRRP